jgi:hypothetical protein
MGQKRMLAYILMGVGIILVLGSLLVDAIGMGSNPGFGKFQGVAMLVGGVIGITGFLLNR